LTRYYLDTSVAVYAIEGHRRAVAWFDAATEQHEVVSSRILQTELTRVLRRQQRPVLERDYLLDKIATAPLSESVLTTAESITEHVKTLDAIHLATALSLGSGTVMVSHDAGVLRVAAALGLRTVDPVAET
jgi:predicted nucleic acid-binding protein